MLIVQPGSGPRLGDLLKKLLADGQWQHFVAAVAFVKHSGVQHIAEELRSFAERGTVKMLVGVDLGGTSREGLAGLLACIGERGEIWICHNEGASTFHPKVYIFRNKDHAVVAMGSGNLTEGGLFTNYEASMMRVLDLGNSDERTFLAELDAALGKWLAPEAGTSHKLTPEFLEKLCQQGYVVEERRARGDEKTSQEGAGAGASRPSGLFARGTVSRPPPRPRSAARTRTPIVARPKSVPIAAGSAGRATFVMTLQQTDVGVGQKTRGAQARSPEVFIPMGAVHKARDFWGWPTLFTPDAAWKGKKDKDGRGKMDRNPVRMLLAGEIVAVHWWYNPEKIDVRLRNSKLRKAGKVGDVLKIEKAPAGSDFEYSVHIAETGTPEHARLLALCTEKVKNPSKKMYGYV